jgi:hypothetical protein
MGISTTLDLGDLAMNVCTWNVDNRINPDQTDLFREIPNKSKVLGIG